MDSHWRWIEWIEFIIAYGWPKNRKPLSQQLLEYERAYAPGRLAARAAERWAMGDGLLSGGAGCSPSP